MGEYPQIIKKVSSSKSVNAAAAAPRVTPEANLEMLETSDDRVPNIRENVKNYRI